MRFDRIATILAALGALALGEGTKRVRDVMRPARFIPQSRAVDDVLRALEPSQDAAPSDAVGAR